MLADKQGLEHMGQNLSEDSPNQDVHRLPVKFRVDPDFLKKICSKVQKAFTIFVQLLPTRLKQTKQL